MRQVDKLFFLSGGIEPEDLEKLREFEKAPVAAKLFSIDINSRFEISAGIKDLDKIKTFVNALKNG